MPDDRTFITELTTALGMLGGTDVVEAVTSRPRALRVSDDHWTRLTRLIREGTNSAEVEAAFENGRAFLHSPDALRRRRPTLIEWTGGRRPPGDEVAPIDLRIDHVFLVSCKYLSANIANPSPGRLFEGLLATSGVWGRGDWYMETAPRELAELYLECRSWAGLFDLPEDPTKLDLADRKRLRQALPPRVFPPRAQDSYRALCNAVSVASAKRWTDAIDRYGNPEQVLWRLLRIGSAPYYLLGADSRRSLRLRISSPWDWRQEYRFLRLDISPSDAGQPQVNWVASYEERSTRRRGEVRGHVEVRWSHGRFVHPPEAKIYLDTPTDELPGYHQLPGRAPRPKRSVERVDQPRLFGDPAEYREPVLGFVDPEAGIDPAKPAVLIGGDSLSYGDLDRRSAALAHVMVDHGVKTDEPVAVMLPNGFEIIEAGIATAKAGAAFLPVNWHLGSDEVGWILSDSGTRLLISHIELAETARSALEHAPGCDLVLVGDDSEEGYESLLKKAPVGDPDVDSRASLSYRFYTSGTTGRPRGVERDNAVDDRTGASTRRVLKMWGMTSDDVFLATGPIYHAAGSYAFLSLHAGSTVSVLSKFDGPSWLAAVDDHRVNVTLMVPAHFIRVLEVPAPDWEGLDLTSLRLVLHAAAPCPISVKRRIMDALPSADVWEFYGASEGGVSRISPDEWRERPGSVGRPWPGVEVTIRDDDGTVLESGETGLVFMTSPGGRFKYHRDPSKTDAAWRGESYTLGDVGHLDADGYLYLTDRAADVVIRGGVNIYPAEIEQVLAAHEAVVDCAVFGIPDERSGEAIRALVELRTPTDVTDLIEHCRAHLALYKCPQEIIEVPELPRDPSGKVRKRHLRDQAWEGHANRIRVD